MRRGLLALALALAGCGGAAASAPESLAVGRVTAEPAPAVAAPVPSRRVASNAVRLRWPFGDDAAFALYADVGTLLATELLAGPAASLLGSSGLGAADAACARALLASAREVAAGADGRGNLLVLRFDPDRAEVAPSTCFTRLTPEPIDGALEGYRVGGPASTEVIAIVAGVILFGDEPVVKAALRKKTTGAWPEALSLPPRRHLAFTVRAMGGELRGRGELTIERELIHLGVEGDVPAALAPSLEAQVGRLTAGVRSGTPDAEAVDTLLRRAISFDRDGGHVRMAFDLRGSTADQTRAIALLTRTASDGVQAYLVASKAAVGRMATSIEETHPEE